MEKIKIQGGVPLSGVLPISGAKNAALPLMAACLLTDSPLILHNVPALADVICLSELLTELGVRVQRDSLFSTFTLSAEAPSSCCAPYDIVRKMRASILVLGPLLARHGRATVSLPGGCAIGTRPVDIHLKGLQALGADIEIVDGYIVAQAPRGLQGAEISFSVPSVTATENLMMAATLARGQTRLIHVAREPEIVDLAHCLIAMGAQIEGAGTDTLTIQGQETLQGATYRVLPDRIETGTFAIAAAMTGGSLTLQGTSLELIPCFAGLLQKAGVTLIQKGEDLWVQGPDRIEGVDVMTEPFPGFPTDLQAQMMALMTRCRGASMITETIFENRFMHVPELCRMGADITVHGSSALVRGVSRLRGAPVMATDLRASVSLVLAGLAAEGETFINRVYHLDRGYEKIEEKLRLCGAQIQRIAG